MHLHYVLLSCIHFTLVITQQLPKPKLDIDWSRFLSRSDITISWTDAKSAPEIYHESAFVGNGAQGAMVYCLSDNEGLRLDVSRTDVYDDRPVNAPYSVKPDNFVLNRFRMPIGHFEIRTKGKVINGSMRVRLYEAEAVGTVITDAGKIDFWLIANADTEIADVMIMQVNTSGSEKVNISWIPSPADSSWAKKDKTYKKNANAVISEIATKNIVVCRQDHYIGTSHATSYSLEASDNVATLFVAISRVSNNGSKEAIEEIQKALSLGVSPILSAHRNWWSSYYQLSFVTFSQSKYESFYWIQVYKMGSATRGGRAPHDLVGPWFVEQTSWPDLHWDLNLQFTYYMTSTSNRLLVGQSLVELLNKAWESGSLSGNALPQYQNDSAAAPSGASSLESKMSCYWNHGEAYNGTCLTTPPTVMGNLLWASHLYYLHGRYSSDATLLRDKFYPILRAAVMYYTHLQTPDSKGIFHLPNTFSPEYPGGTGPDTNYDLMLYKWALRTLLTEPAFASKRDKDPAKQLWQDSLDHLVPYPVDSRGYMVNSKTSFSKSHRHFSHLMALWPLKDPAVYNSPKAIALAERSLDNWLSMPSQLTGFARPAASMMNTQLNRPAAAFSNLTFFFNRYVHTNTMYSEGGGPCGESPPAASSAIQDMFLVSMADDSIAVFAGVDDAVVTDVSFHQLRADGGLLVSAKRSTNAHQVKWIYFNNTGTNLRSWTIRTGIASAHVEFYPPDANVTIIRDGVQQIKLHPGQALSIYPRSTQQPPTMIISPAPGNSTLFNYWGKKPAYDPHHCEAGYNMEHGYFASNSIAHCDNSSMSEKYCIVSEGVFAFNLCTKLGNACKFVGLPLDEGWIHEYPGKVQLMTGSDFSHNGWDLCAKTV